ncbi:MAG: hypothetical protein A2X05_18415 [Bacteroidetes bacterium GWE2_41_25]|nr:MAG: hypothetical protein A2X03_07320 [Bacteroidetes bacterium GWA2_40_15]OFX84515.1 MAG: hypothetical protein A2X06_11410 [Bacteroidetes bacterium GWC2_40_22]OFY04373.1 MAG: hypothetical protein A2X05_18415 [Bacteroidetes bacterium GWE2_41_25]OFY56874.1 MAG: hypothetical protein A2X04_06260 [Bacteroidetes bacterium GWF2_41_9]
MTAKLNISADFHKQLFWDVDLTDLDADRSKRLIIERVFALGTLKEVKLVLEYYGTETVTDVLKKLNYIDPKTLNFVSAYFKVSLESFKCYRRKQSIRQHWDS